VADQRREHRAGEAAGGDVSSRRTGGARGDPGGGGSLRELPRCWGPDGFWHGGGGRPAASGFRGTAGAGYGNDLGDEGGRDVGDGGGGAGGGTPGGGGKCFAAWFSDREKGVPGVIIERRGSLLCPGYRQKVPRALQSGVQETWVARSFGGRYGTLPHGVVSNRRHGAASPWSVWRRISTPILALVG